MAQWLVDESQPLSGAEALEATRQEFGFDRTTEPAINVALFDVTIHDVKKWFGSADIRIDALVVTPTASENHVYQANTFMFPGVRDGETLGIERDAGLGLYTGWPQYLLDLSLMASVGAPGQKTLSEILAEGAEHLGGLLGKVAKLTSAAPQAAAIIGAGAAAVELSGSVLQLLGEVSGKSVGLYRATWYEHRHRFGIGHHPADLGRYRERDLEFRYEIFQDRPNNR